MTAYMVCSRCWGHGVHMNGAAEVADCAECEGSGQVRARDEHGRFTTLISGESK